MLYTHIFLIFHNLNVHLDLAKVDVEGSNPFTRSKNKGVIRVFLDTFLFFTHFGRKCVILGKIEIHTPHPNWHSTYKEVILNTEP